MTTRFARLAYLKPNNSVLAYFESLWHIFLGFGILLDFWHILAYFWYISPKWWYFSTFSIWQVGKKILQAEVESAALFSFINHTNALLKMQLKWSFWTMADQAGKLEPKACCFCWYSNMVCKLVIYFTCSWGWHSLHLLLALARRVFQLHPYPHQLAHLPPSNKRADKTHQKL